VCVAVCAAVCIGVIVEFLLQSVLQCVYMRGAVRKGCCVLLCVLQFVLHNVLQWVYVQGATQNEQPLFEHGLHFTATHSATHSAAHIHTSTCEAPRKKKSHSSTVTKTLT